MDLEDLLPAWTTRRSVGTGIRIGALTVTALAVISPITSAEPRRADWTTDLPHVSSIDPNGADAGPIAGDPTDPDGDASGVPAGFPSRAVNCIIAPYEVVEIKSTVRGRITELRAERSDLVAAGDVVVQLDSRLEQAAVDLARARSERESQIRARESALALGERRSERTRRLYDGDAVSTEAVDEAETEVELARQELEGAREERRLASLDLERALAARGQRTIASPIPGVVTERFLSIGEVVDDEPILRVAQLDPLRVEVILPASRFAEVRPGMRARVVPEHVGDRDLVASVEIVDRVIDAASGTFGVRLRLPNPDHAVPSGLNCQIEFLD